MKKILFILLALSISLIYAQDDDKFSFGFTAGFNYNSNGEYVTNGGFTGISEQFKSKKKTGYHGGIYLEYNFNSMYVRPEVLYTKDKSAYDEIVFDQTKIKVPVMVGFDIFKGISIFVGPSFQYVLENELEGFDVNEIDLEQDLAVNFQAGLALKLFGQVRLDIRYEKGLSDNILTIRQDTNGILNTLNTKPEQIVLSLSLQL